MLFTSVVEDGNKLQRITQ